MFVGDYNRTLTVALNTKKKSNQINRTLWQTFQHTAANVNIA